MNNQLLLLEDVDNLGRKGELVKVKPGFSRNFLLPKKKAIFADKRTIRMQKRLQEERAKQAEIDRKASEELAKQIEGKTIHIEVKVDTSGRLFGSVSAADIATQVNNLIEGELDKKAVKIAKPIKKTGEHQIEIALKEGVMTHVVLHVKGEGMPEEPQPAAEEASAREEQEEGQEEKPETEEESST